MLSTTHRNCRKKKGFSLRSKYGNHLAGREANNLVLPLTCSCNDTLSELFQAMIVVDDCTQTGELYSEDRE